MKQERNAGNNKASEQTQSSPRTGKIRVGGSAHTQPIKALEFEIQGKSEGEKRKFRREDMWASCTQEGYQNDSAVT